MRIPTSHLFPLVPLLAVPAFAAVIGCSSSDTTTPTSTGAGGAATTTTSAATGTGTGGTGGGATGSSTGTGGAPAASPKVLLIMMENHNWSDISASSSSPYIKELLTMGGHTEQYFNPPKLHPSEPNYIWLEAGDNLGVTDDLLPAAHHFATTDHLVTQIEKAGLTWKAYQEDITGTECPIKPIGKYAPKHNPMVYFDDVTDGNMIASQKCIDHERPYTELAGDLMKDTIPHYSFITPNLCHDMHDTCAPQNDSIKQGDDWLAAEVPKILASKAFAEGATLLITWDEGENNVDGPIGMIVLGKYAKVGYASKIHYTHSSTLRTVQEIFGLSPFLGDAANATDLVDLFTALPSSTK
jgi:phosphatidylinositol-3-phosphatase